MRTLAILLFVLVGLPACNGPAAAARDFIDPYKIAVGAGSGAGVRGASLGLVETGLSFGVKPNAGALGLRYGRFYTVSPDAQGAHFNSDQSLIYKTDQLVDADFASGSFVLGRRSLALLPAVFTWVDSADKTRREWDVPDEGVDLAGEHYLWSARTWRNERYAMVHAFDIEAEIMILAYIEVGFSIGEWADFWTSLVGFDLAGDDDR